MVARAKNASFRVAQTNLNAGEITPRLHARANIDLYLTGLATCRNFIPHVTGGVANRPGTRFIAYCGDETARPRLIPFRFSQGAGQNYVLEFGNLYFRIFKDGAQVLYPSGPSIGQPVEIVSPYATADLEQLNWTQSADVMTLVHPSYAPRQLTRTDHHLWTFSTLTFAPTVAAPIGSDVTLTHGGVGTGTDWKYQVTWQTATGEESLPGPTETMSHATSLSTTNYIDVAIGSYPAGVVYANIYKYRGGTYGWIGNTADGTFRDDGIAPQLNETPPRAANPFSGSSDYPAATAYFQQRLAFARTYNDPETIWLSQTGAYLNFTTSEPIRDSDAITATLAGQNVDVIRHLVPTRALLILTKGGVWTLERGDNGLTPTLDGGLTSELAEGSSLLRPILAGSDCLYVHEGGRAVRAIDFDISRSGLASEDVSLRAEHLLRASPAVDWAWQPNPNRLVWIVRDDGVLLSLSYLKSEQVFGWAQHDTIDGEFEAVASIPEGSGDAVYFVVRRWLGDTWRRCVEQLASRNQSNIRDAFIVDCGLSLDEAIDLTGLEVVADEVEVTAPGHGLSEGDVIDISGVSGTGVNNRRFLVGLPITTDTFRLYESGADTGEDEDTPLDGSELSGLYRGGGAVRLAVTTVSGLDHLEGEEVSVLADGSVEGPYTVLDGAVTLLRPASRVHVGLPITAQIRTLPIASAQSAEMRARMKRITSLQLHVESARGVWAGPSLDALEEYLQRTDELLGDPTQPTSGLIELTIPATWNQHGQVYVEQTDPLPLEILGVSPAFEVGSS